MTNLNVFKPCVVIPVYNHDGSMPATLRAIKAFNIPCIIVNDGSNKTCSDSLAALDKKYPWVDLQEHDINQGKGAAVKTGLKAALAAGYSHAVQIDADGQHKISDIPAFLGRAEANPNNIIIGSPIYDESVPKHRQYARYLTHVWVWINTLSLSIKDSMCGFRVYPLEKTVALIESHYVGDRMDFDVEVLVKSFWQKTTITSLTTEVLYPEDGISHFLPFKDNVLISLMHTRLFFGMLKRLPYLLKMKLQTGKMHAR